MKPLYFYDCQCIDIDGKCSPISIAMIDYKRKETLYYINSEVDTSKASDWVKNNILNELESKENRPDLYLSLPEIREKIIQFTLASLNSNNNLALNRNSEIFLKNLNRYKAGTVEKTIEKISLWGYNVSYSHYALTKIMGGMLNYPPHFPLYSNELNQELEKVEDAFIPLPYNNYHSLRKAVWCMHVYEYIASNFYEESESDSEMENDFESESMYEED